MLLVRRGQRRESIIYIRSLLPLLLLLQMHLQFCEGHVFGVVEQIRLARDEIHIAVVVMLLIHQNEVTF